MRSSVFVCAQSWRGILSTVVKVPVYSFHKKNPQDSSSHVSSDPVEIPVDLCESIGEALAATQTRAERHHTVLNQFGKKKLPTKHFFQFFVRPAGIGHPPPILRILLEESTNLLLLSMFSEYLHLIIRSISKSRLCNFFCDVCSYPSPRCRRTPRPPRRIGRCSTAPGRTRSGTQSRSRRTSSPTHGL